MQSAPLQFNGGDVLVIACVVLTSCGGISDTIPPNASNPGGATGAGGTAIATAGSSVWATRHVAATSGRTTGGLTTRESSGGAVTSQPKISGGGGSGDANTTSAQGGSAGSALTQAGAAGSARDMQCDIGALLLAIERTALPGGDGSCYVSWNAGASDTYGNPWGAVIIDSEGRVEAATGPARGIESKLVEQRIACYSDQILLYWCYGVL